MSSRKQIAAGQRRSLRSMREKLLDMAAVWGEVDQYNMNSLEELAAKMEEIAMQMVDQEDEE